VVAIAISGVIGGVLVAVLGSDPLNIYGTLLRGSLVGWPNFSVTLQQTTPLIFTGLAVSVAFRAGVWNIGVEGQMLMGAMAAGILGYSLHMPAVLHLPLCVLAAMVGGALWAAIPGLLRAYLNVNELVLCLMLNPMALLFTGYLSAHPLRAPGATNKLPDVLASAQLPGLSRFSQLNYGIFVAAFLVIVVAAFNLRSVRGFEWKFVGLNARFAHYGGIDVRANTVLVMLVSGAIAGAAGAEQALGVYHAYYDNFSPGYGFDGIAVAMLAEFNPFGVVASSFLFGALNSGSAILQMMTNISSYLVQVLQFITVLLLAAHFSWTWLRTH
jgi:general nucleoside transport system permease protein